MSERHDGGTAFPSERRHTVDQDGRWIDRWIPEGGMSLRDYFAGQALTLGGEFFHLIDQRDESQSAHVAAIAYEIADAMLKAREA